MHTMLALFGMSLLVAEARPAGPGIVVRGDTPCPTSDAVSAALVGLLAHHGEEGSPDQLRLLPAAGGPGAAGVTLVLTNAAGELVARREIRAEATS